MIVHFIIEDFRLETVVPKARRPKVLVHSTPYLLMELHFDLQCEIVVFAKFGGQLNRRVVPQHYYLE